MSDYLINYLKDKITLSQSEIELIRSVSILKKILKNQYVLQEGDVWRFNAFVGRGLVKTFSIDSKGQEHIMNFSPENYWTGDRESLTTENPSEFNIMALENSEIILIKKEEFNMICRRIPQLNDLVNEILHKSFLASQKRIHAGISMSAEEKYQDFIQKNSLIMNRIPQHMIASYLGVSPETLSRIRAQAIKK